MTKRSSYIEQRLIKKHQNKISIARVVLFALGSIFLIITLLSFSNSYGFNSSSGFLLLTSLITGIIYIGLGILSKSYPKLVFLISFVFVLISLLRSFLNINLLGIIFNTVFAVAMFNGFQAAKKMEEYQSNIPQNENILDSNLD